MEPKFTTLPETLLVGKRSTMTFAADTTRKLWQSFIPAVPSLAHRADTHFYSVEVYPDLQFFKNFNPSREFEKWAAVKVNRLATLPPSLEALVLPAGRYAVFTYRGKASEASSAYKYIYGTWLPASEYALDNRPHFAVMGDNYKNEDPASEEELWIPVRKK